MSKVNFLARTVIAISLLCSGSALAEVCVKVDETKDSLSPAERNAAVGLMENAFRKAGETVATGDCGASSLASGGHEFETTADEKPRACHAPPCHVSVNIYSTRI